MFRNREELHEVLKECLGSNHVYFQPPENLCLDYPAIVYRVGRVDNVHASNKVYAQFTAYDVTTIDFVPDSEVADKISKLPMTEFDRFYISDKLNHYVFRIYF